MQETMYIDQRAVPLLCEIGPHATGRFGGGNNPIKAVKFLKSEDKKYWLSEASFRIRPWDYYLKMENRGVAGVADANEGRHQIRFDDYSIATGNSGHAADFERLRKIGFLDASQNVQPNAEFVAIRSGITRKAPSAHVMCLGAVNDRPTRERWKATEQYDTAIEIKNLAAFAIELRLAAAEQLEWTSLELVSYGAQAADAGDNYYTGHVLFRKDHDYSWQNEIRVAWNIGHECNDDVIVHAPNAVSYLQDVS